MTRPDDTATASMLREHLVPPDAIVGITVGITPSTRYRTRIAVTVDGTYIADVVRALIDTMRTHVRAIRPDFTITCDGGATATVTIRY